MPGIRVGACHAIHTAKTPAGACRVFSLSHQDANAAIYLVSGTWLILTHQEHDDKKMHTHGVLRFRLTIRPRPTCKHYHNNSTNLQLVQYLPRSCDLKSFHTEGVRVQRITKQGAVTYLNRMFASNV